MPVQPLHAGAAQPAGSWCCGACSVLVKSAGSPAGSPGAVTSLPRQRQLEVAQEQGPPGAAGNSPEAWPCPPSPVKEVVACTRAAQGAGQLLPPEQARVTVVEHETDLAHLEVCSERLARLSRRVYRHARQQQQPRQQQSEEQQQGQGQAEGEQKGPSAGLGTGREMVQGEQQRRQWQQGMSSDEGCGAQPGCLAAEAPQPGRREVDICSTSNASSCPGHGLPAVGSAGHEASHVQERAGGTPAVAMAPPQHPGTLAVLHVAPAGAGGVNSSGASPALASPALASPAWTPHESADSAGPTHVRSGRRAPSSAGSTERRAEGRALTEVNQRLSQLDLRLSQLAQSATRRGMHALQCAHAVVAAPGGACLEATKGLGMEVLPAMPAADHFAIAADAVVPQAAAGTAAAEEPQLAWGVARCWWSLCAAPQPPRQRQQELQPQRSGQAQVAGGAAAAMLRAGHPGGLSPMQPRREGLLEEAAKPRPPKLAVPQLNSSLILLVQVCGYVCRCVGSNTRCICLGAA
jgi:hypothetical protein